MKKKRILLTGDDGYNALGTRLLIHYLKNDFDLTIAATKNQQSGVGGMVHVREGGSWGEDTVDGVHAYWFDGSPVDTIGCISGIIKEPYDYVISGINCGPNIGVLLICSGTYSAAYYSLGVGLTKHAMAISWDVAPEMYHKNHSHTDDISMYLEYPGKIAGELVIKTIENNWWGVPLVNINLPMESSSEVVFSYVKPQKIFEPPIMEYDTNRFRYSLKRLPKNPNESMTDVEVINEGHISISLLTPDMTDYTKINELKDTKITL